MYYNPHNTHNQSRVHTTLDYTTLYHSHTPQPESVTELDLEAQRLRMLWDQAVATNNFIGSAAPHISSPQQQQQRSTPQQQQRSAA